MGHCWTTLTQLGPALQEGVVQVSLQPLRPLVVVQRLDLVVGDHVLDGGLGLGVDRGQLRLLLALHVLLVLAALLTEQVAQPLELVDVQLLQTNQLFAHDLHHLLGRILASVPEIGGFAWLSHFEQKRRELLVKLDVFRKLLQNIPFFI